MSEYIVWIVIIIAILLNITYNALVIDEARKSNSHNGRSRLIFACISTAVITILLIYLGISRRNIIAEKVGSAFSSLGTKLGQTAREGQDQATILAAIQNNPELVTQLLAAHK